MNNSTSYIIGITEGRKTLNQFKTDNIATLNHFQTAHDIAARLAKENFSDTMKDCFRGQRDFWANQLKISN